MHPELAEMMQQQYRGSRPGVEGQVGRESSWREWVASAVPDWAPALPLAECPEKPPEHHVE